MNMLLRFLSRPAPEALPHVKVRYVVAAKSDNTKLSRKKAETTAALRRIVTEQKLVAAVKAALEESTAALKEVQTEPYSREGVVGSILGPNPKPVLKPGPSIPILCLSQIRGEGDELA